FSRQIERCDGKLSITVSGAYDVDGDGKPESVRFQDGVLAVNHLTSGATLGTPEAGRLVEIDNVHGAQTRITYRSAKEDGTTWHFVPSPEIVVTSVETTGLAPIRYAYGHAELIFDPALDAYTMRAYGRSVELRVGPAPAGGGIEGAATITVPYRLAPFVAPISDADRFARYERAGRVRDVTVL